MYYNPTVLLVDDSENDRLLTRVAFKEAGFNGLLQEAYNGEDAIAYFKGDGIYGDRQKFPMPAVLLLDLNMPLKNGFQVMEWVRSQPALNRMSVVVLTASMRNEDVERAYELGANSYLVKSSTIKDLVGMIRCLCDWLQFNHFPPSNETVRR